MAIPVIFSNSTAGMIEIYRLDDLISQGKVVAYKHSGRWVKAEVTAEKETDFPEIKQSAEEKVVRIHENTTVHSPEKPPKEDKEMLISVIYKNNRRGMIDEYLLDDLLKEDKIKAFRRAGGWVKVGRDPVREKWKQSSYSGPERRKRELPPDYFL